MAAKTYLNNEDKGVANGVATLDGSGNLVQDAGSTSDVLTQSGSKTYATASGTDTYTATITPAITAYAAGQSFAIKFTNANTGAATLNLNALGAKAITKNGTTALVSGDISANQVYLVTYDGTQFQIVGRITASSSTVRAMALGADEAWNTYGSGVWTIVWSAGDQYLTRVSGGATTGQARRSHKVEPDLVSCPANAFSIDTFANSLAGSLTLTVYINGVADTNMNGVSIEPSVINTWETKTFTFNTDPSAGDTLAIEVVSTATGAAQGHQINNLQIKYND